MTRPDADKNPITETSQPGSQRGTDREIRAVFKTAQAKAAEEGFPISDEALEELIPEYKHVLHPVDIRRYLVSAWQLGQSPLETYRQSCEREKEPREKSLRRYAKEAQASMAIEGYIISDEESERCLQEYMNDPEIDRIFDMITEAERRGEKVNDVLAKYFREKYGEDK